MEKPNIIFILTDDQRWDALGYAGNPIIQTPHMDQMARSGLYERTHDYTFGKLALIDRYLKG